MIIPLRMAAVFGYAAVLFAQLDQREYGGPSVLSRGLAPSIATAGRDFRISPYIGVNGFCDSGLTGLTIDATGKIPDLTTCGVEGYAGVHGYRQWRKTVLGIDYRGNYRHYPNYKYYNGTDQTLSFGVGHQLSKRTSITFREAAGTYSRNYIPASGYGFFDPSSLNVPTTELFDNRVYYVLTGGDLTYQKSARLSFNMGGSGYLVRHRSTSLFGMTGSSARGDIVYRYSRFGSIGVFYSFSHVEFTKAFGASDFHSGGVVYSVRLSRSWEMGMRAGVSRVESLALQSVPVDPVVAAIIGQVSGVVATYRLNYVPDGAVQLAKHFRRANLAFTYERIVMPGNGIYLTSGQEAAYANYSYTGVRHWNFGASGGYTRLIPLLQTSTTDYRLYSGGVGVTRDLLKGLQFVLRFDERSQEVGTLRRHGYRGSVGIAWSPGEVPLTLW